SENRKSRTPMVTNTESNSDAKSSVYLQDKEEVKKVFKRFDASGDEKISAMASSISTSSQDSIVASDSTEMKATTMAVSEN
ncbi:hypothetical protein U1Q18_040276, partial [Sarracenia purpurea var. burkii]